MFKLHLVIAALVSVAFFGQAIAQNEISTEYRAFIKETKESLVSNFKDPGSVQWRGMFIGGYDSSTIFLCGEVNAKNSYGAYVGFRRFLSAGKSKFSMVEDEDNAVDFNVEWLTACIKHIYEIPM